MNREDSEQIATTLFGRFLGKCWKCDEARVPVYEEHIGLCNICLEILKADN